LLIVRIAIVVLENLLIENSLRKSVVSFCMCPCYSRIGMLNSVNALVPR
jgi:hypothetical protein